MNLIEKNKIYNQDCLTTLSNIPDNFIDCIITSPPYDNLRTYNDFVKGKPSEFNGYSFNFEKIAKELFRVTKNGGIVVWVVGDGTEKGSETGTSFRQALYFKEIGFNLHDTMIYQKNNFSNPSSNRYHQIFEYMFVFSKGVVSKHNPIMVPCLHAGLELGNTTYKNYSKGEQTRTKIANPVKAEKVKGNIWEYVVGKKKEDQDAKEHPAPFPSQLARDHIVSWSNEGDVVLDPMCGSGTTCKVAKEMKRNFIGMDVSAEYCKIAEKRVSNAVDYVPPLEQQSLV